MKQQKNSLRTITNPYEEFVKKSLERGENFRIISGVELQSARKVINAEVTEKVARVQYLERQERIKSASWVIK